MVDNNESKKRVLLITLDGWGAGLAGPANIFNEETAPKLSALLDSYPYTQLATCASDLGYGKQVITDSKIGHLALALAAPLEKQSGVSFFKEEELATALKQLKQKESDCHILLDARNIEAIDDFKWCVTLAERKKIKQLYVHLLLSEVDNFDLTVWQALMAGHDNIKIIQLIKADYALNDSYEWEKTALTYRAVVDGESNDAVIKKIEATKIVLAENDVVLFLGRELSVWFQLASSLTSFEFGEFERKLPSGLKCLSVDAAKQRGLVLPKLLAQHDLKQVVITESYGAIAACYYGGGLACSPEAGQDWVIFNSPLYSELPNEILESSEKIIDYSIDLINDQDYDFVHINLATLDLARQCADVELVTRCLATLDKLSARVIKAALDRNFLVLLGSTCSGSEAIVDVVSGAQTIKNTNALVPFVIISSDLEGRSFSSLEGARNDAEAGASQLSLLDIAPTVLAYFNIHQPSSMSGKSLI